MEQIPKHRLMYICCQILYIDYIYIYMQYRGNTIVVGFDPTVNERGQYPSKACPGGSLKQAAMSALKMESA